MKRLTNLISNSICAAAIVLPMTAIQAHATAGPGQVMHINGDGRKICRSLAQYRAPYWEVKIRGRFLDAYAGRTRFTLKTCFESRSQCFSYANRIRHVVQGVETVDYAQCTER